MLLASSHELKAIKSINLVIFLEKPNFYLVLSFDFQLLHLSLEALRPSKKNNNTELQFPTAIASISYPTFTQNVFFNIVSLMSLHWGARLLCGAHF